MLIYGKHVQNVQVWETVLTVKQLHIRRQNRPAISSIRHNDTAEDMVRTETIFLYLVIKV
jgi:hypothetical protein